MVNLLSVCLYFNFMMESPLFRMLIPSAGQLKNVTLVRFMTAFAFDNPGKVSGLRLFSIISRYNLFI